MTTEQKFQWIWSGVDTKGGQYPVFMIDATTTTSHISPSMPNGMPQWDIIRQLRGREPDHPLISELTSTPYFKYIPQRYGRCRALDCALQALVAKMREILEPSNRLAKMEALRAYGAALQAARQAIEDGNLGGSADLLLAAELLRLVETTGISGCSSSSSSSSKAWSKHFEGALRMVQSKGPAGFETQYERDLLGSLASSIICDYVARNEPCFLEETAWQELLGSSIITSDDDGDAGACERHSIYISLLQRMAHLPRLFTRVASVVRRRLPPPPHVPDDGAADPILIADVRTFRGAILEHYANLKSLHAPSSSSSSGSSAGDIHEELKATTLSTLAISNRLLTALGDAGGANEEDPEAQALSCATSLAKMEADAVRARGQASPLIRRKAAIGAAISSTAAAWRAAAAPGQVIDEHCFVGWCEALGRNHYAGPLMMPPPRSR